jgi:hypothetical protein
MDPNPLSIRVPAPAPSPPHPAPLPAPPALLLAAAAFHSAMAGSFYGFWQLVSMLQAEGGLREACPAAAAPAAAPAAGCPAQDVAWGNLFTYGSVLAFGVPLLSGVLLMPALGPRRTVLALTAVFAAGFALLLASTGDGTSSGSGQPPPLLQSALILPAVCCIAVASSANYLPLLSVASLFTRSPLALSLISGSFDAGSGVFLVFRLLYARGTPLRTLLAAFLGGPVLCMVALALALWREAPFEPPRSSPASPRAVLAALAASGSVHGARAALAPLAPGASPAAAATAAVQQADEAATAAGADKAAAAEAEAAEAVAASEAAAAPPFLPGLNAARLVALPLLGQLTTAEYLAFLAYFCALALRFNWYLASVSLQLGALGSAADIDPYLTALGYLMPTLALPAVLVAGHVLDTRGPLAGLALLSCLGALLSALQLVPSLPLQGLAALVFVLYRGTLFSCLSVLLSHLFGFARLSALVGTVTCLSGVFSLLTTPLLGWGVASGFAAPNFLLLALCLASLGFPAWMAVRGGHRSLLHALRVL